MLTLAFIGTFLAGMVFGVLAIMALAASGFR